MIQSQAVSKNVSDSFSVSPDNLKRLAKLVADNNLSELRYEVDGMRVTMRTASYQPAAPLVAAHTTLAAPEAGMESAESFVVGDDSLPNLPAPSEETQAVKSPIMGVFYRSPSPEEPMFVEVGDEVSVGQVIGLIEAMKTFSPVESEFAGRVVAIPAENRSLVHPGDALILLSPEENL
jgi:acetyl-CoA carboxylase biotin carboxyl carrier protein